MGQAQDTNYSNGTAAAADDDDGIPKPPLDAIGRVTQEFPATWFQAPLTSGTWTTEVLLQDPNEVWSRSSLGNTDFHFDFDVHAACAAHIIGSYPKINRLRFKLVPGRMKEDEFWRRLLMLLCIEFERTRHRKGGNDAANNSNNANHHSNDDNDDGGGGDDDGTHSNDTHNNCGDADDDTTTKLMMMQLPPLQEGQENEAYHRILELQRKQIQRLQKRVAALTSNSLTQQSRQQQQRRQPQCCKRCGRADTADEQRRCSVHSGDWELTESAQEFLSLEHEIKEGMRAEKLKRLEAVRKQLEWIVLTDNPQDGPGHWSCCRSFNFDDPGCALTDHVYHSSSSSSSSLPPPT